MLQKFQGARQSHPQFFGNFMVRGNNSHVFLNFMVRGNNPFFSMQEPEIKRLIHYIIFIAFIISNNPERGFQFALENINKKQRSLIMSFNSYPE